MKPHIEPFEWYTGIGKPWLTIKRNPKWSHVEWGDGTLFKYPEFGAVVRHSSLEGGLTRLFNENCSGLSSRSVLARGGVHGAFVYCPSVLAETVFNEVREVFAEVLRTLE